MTSNLDNIRESVLARIDRSDRAFKITLAGAAALELGLFVAGFVLVDWHVRLERLLFVFSVLSYTLIVAGLVAHAAYMNRSIGQFLAGLDRGTSR